MAEQKKPIRVTKGKVVVRKKQRSAFEESIESAGKYIFNDVLVPTIKDMLSEAITGATDQILYGGERPARKREGKQSSHISYNKISSNKTRVHPRSTRRGGSFDFDKYIVETRREADDVIDGMFALLDQYGTVTVSDFKNLIDVTSLYTDDNFGWTTLKGARAIRIREGFTFDLPTPIEID